MDENGKENRVGITLVTGFLGAGKSTLINRVLTESHNLRIVVIENEFSETGVVEKAIVTRGVGDETLDEFIELPNGCICCAAQDDLADALTRLVTKRAGQFDHVLVEASGLADPGPVAASLWIDDGLEVALHLDSVVAVVDAAHVRRHLTAKNGHATAEASVAAKQLAVADTVLLNKVDLLATDDDAPVEQGVEALTSLLRQHGCIARVIPTTQCDVDLRSLLNVRAYDATETTATLSSSQTELPMHVHDSAPPAVERVALEFRNVVFDSELLTRAMGTLLWDEDGGEDLLPASGGEIWRMKALVAVLGEEYYWIYQGVHTLFDDAVSSEVVPSDSSFISRFLFIGKKLNKGIIDTRLKRAIVPR